MTLLAMRCREQSIDITRLCWHVAHSSEVRHRSNSLVQHHNATCIKRQRAFKVKARKGCTVQVCAALPSMPSFQNLALPGNAQVSWPGMLQIGNQKLVTSHLTSQPCSARMHGMYCQICHCTMVLIEQLSNCSRTTVYTSP